MEIIVMRKKVEPVLILIDKDDYKKLGKRKISIGSHGYAQIWDAELKRVLLLHRWVMGITEKTGYKFICDHINRNRMDKRKENLRLVSPTDSNDNRMERPKNSNLPKHIFMMRNYFQVSLKRGGKCYYVGTFKTIDQAITERDNWLSTHHKTENGYIKN